jgi:hypothetical protein
MFSALISIAMDALTGKARSDMFHACDRMPEGIQC